MSLNRYGSDLEARTPRCGRLLTGIVAQARKVGGEELVAKLREHFIRLSNDPEQDKTCGICLDVYISEVVT
jgi:hypothetical protein